MELNTGISHREKASQVPGREPARTSTTLWGPSLDPSREVVQQAWSGEQLKLSLGPRKCPCGELRGDPMEPVSFPQPDLQSGSAPRVGAHACLAEW